MYSTTALAAITVELIYQGERPRMVTVPTTTIYDLPAMRRSQQPVRSRSSSNREIRDVVSLKEDSGHFVLDGADVAAQMKSSSGSALLVPVEAGAEFTEFRFLRGRIPTTTT